MSRIIENVLNQAFTLVALSGLLLAGWGLISTPDELRAGNEIGRWNSRTQNVETLIAVK